MHFFGTLAVDLFQTVINEKNDLFILGSDFDCTLQDSLDQNGKKSYPLSAQLQQATLQMAGVADSWQHLHPSTRQYGGVKASAGAFSKADLDWLYLNEHHMPLLCHSQFVLSRLSDRSSVWCEMDFVVSTHTGVSDWCVMSVLCVTVRL